VTVGLVSTGAAATSGWLILKSPDVSLSVSEDLSEFIVAAVHTRSVEC